MDQRLAEPVAKRRIFRANSDRKESTVHGTVARNPGELWAARAGARSDLSAATCRSQGRQRQRGDQAAHGRTELDDTEARVLALYVDDTEKKLRALADLARRVRSLLGSLNGKYRPKRLSVDRDDGLVAETDSGVRVPLDSLSSGEQHELVLHYDLLFGVRANTIVLIDEPELSLHVSWQKRFLPDLLDFAKLSSFDAIVATHSPYIIGERDDLMVGLSDQV